MHNAAPHLSRSRRPPWWGWGRQAGGTTSPSSWAAPPVTSPPQTRTHACSLPGSHARDSLTSFFRSNSWLASLQQSERVPESFPTHPSYTDAEVWSHVLSSLCRQLSDLDMCILCFPPLKVTALLEDQNCSHPQWCLITVQVGLD